MLNMFIAPFTSILAEAGVVLKQITDRFCHTDDKNTKMSISRLLKK
ncbi:hypothetical protein J2S74_001490 [Evansella vedderi]|uniref:Uncharacterized protein n=1 Tax=Evansella vedderi TaxID=38282 RepID=A0ABT9ZSB9_9BACI|nr:hypothetical protein [Evansella vedderi]